MAWTAWAAAALSRTLDEQFADDELCAAAAVIDPSGTSITTSGRPVPPDARFEIGSVTKTMTGILLALLADDGTVRLTDPVSHWVPAAAGSSMTLLALGTHTAGLPRLPPPAAGRIDPSNPYAGFTAARAEEALGQAESTPGSYLYSNFGYQLLGLALERASGRPYAELLAERLLVPLGMSGTGLADSGGCAIAGRVTGQPAPHWDQPLPASGGVQATITDLARYCRACLDHPASQLGMAIAAAQAPRVLLASGSAQGLGWHVDEDHSRWHDGSTGGFSAAIVLDPVTGRGAAVAVSTAEAASLVCQAAFLAVRDRDPGDAFRALPLADRARRAREAVLWLLDGQAARVHASLSASFRNRVGVRQLEQLWWMNTLDAGREGDLDVVCRPVSQGIVATVRIAFSNRRISVRLAFDAAGWITDIRISRSPLSCR